MIEHVAERTDPRRGTVDRVRYFGSGGLRMFGTTVMPPATSRGGVLICPSILADFIPNYRREVVLGRELAATGIATQRFHYRGTGHSDGAPEDLTFPSMVGDSIEAASLLAETAHVEQVGFVGTRFGGLTAAAAAAKHPGAPLALWEPTLSPKAFFREAFRAVMMMGVQQADGDRVTSAQLQAQLEEQGATEVLGYPIHKPFHDDVVGRDLATEVGSSPRPILIIQLGGTDLRKDNAAIVESWRSAGFDVTTHVLPTKEAWWFLDDRAVPSADLVRLTVDWFGKQFA